jgi:hypothetical protein
MDRVRRSLLALKISWIALSACISALCVHALLAWLQTIAVLTGNYPKHAHGLVPTAILGAVCAAVAAVILYIVGIVYTAKPWLPSLARSLQRVAKWKLLATIIATASFILVAMELLEQVAANRYDGVMSAFGDQWLFGLLALVACAACMMLLGRACCALLVKAHKRVLRLALSFLGASPHKGAPAGLHVLQVRCCPHRNPKPAVLGPRAPPLFCSAH